MNGFRIDRRRYFRHPVSWKGKLYVQEGENKEILEAKIVTICLGGAGLELGTLMASQTHLVVNDTPPKIILEIPVQGKTISGKIIVRWYRSLDDDKGFLVGAEFTDMTEEELKVLRSVLDTL